MNITEVQGTITFADGSAHEFRVALDPTSGQPTYSQWGASVEQLGHGVGVMEAIEKALNPVGWQVRDNVTGARASRVFDTEDSATRICAALNMREIGGRYGVYTGAGERCL